MPDDLSEEQRLMRQSCRDFVDDVIIPFIRGNWQREWSMTPEDRLPPAILEGAEKVGIRTLGVPEEFGGIELDRASEVQTFALIAEEIARGNLPAHGRHRRHFALQNREINVPGDCRQICRAGSV